LEDLEGHESAHDDKSANIWKRDLFYKNFFKDYVFGVRLQRLFNFFFFIKKGFRWKNRNTAIAINR